MRFLVDMNLLPALAAWLAADGHEALHASELSFQSASYRLIWRYAKENDYCIITKDQDFVLLAAADTEGAKVIWVRIGNALRKIIVPRIAAV